MQELLNNYLPNVAQRLPDFGQALKETLVMVAWSGIICFILGLTLGVLITVTKRGPFWKTAWSIRCWTSSSACSAPSPSSSCLPGSCPVTRAIMGTTINVKGAIVPLVFGSVPFFARQVESALAQVDKGLIEASLSMGSSPLEIIFRVYLREGIPAIARGTTITAISLLNLTAMAGTVGAGGLGDFAVTLGHDRNMKDITNVTVLVLVLLVCLIELIGSRVAKKNTH